MMQIYTVRSGDSIEGIARRFMTDAATLIEINRLNDPSGLASGLALLVPSRRTPHRRIMEVELCASPTVSRSALAELLPLATYLRCPCADGTEDAAFIAAAQAANALPLLSVSNFDRQRGGYSSQEAHALFSDDGRADAFFSGLAQRMRERSYGGAAFDFQYIHPFEKEAYSRFLERAAQTLHPLGAYLLVLAAPAAADGEHSIVNAGQDLAALGELCDRVVLLSHRAVPNEDAARGTLSYAAERIPAGKILLSLPTGGTIAAAPPSKERERSVSACTAAALAAAVGAEICYDAASLTSRFAYTDALGRRRNAVFDDARSALARLQLAEEYGLAGISLFCGNPPCRPLRELLERTVDGEKIL